MPARFDQMHVLVKTYSLSLIDLFGSQSIPRNQYLKGNEVVLDDSSDLDIAVAFQNHPTLSYRNSRTSMPL